MNHRAVFHLIAYTLIVLAIGMSFCAFLAWRMGDPPEAIRGLGLASGITLLTGTVLALSTRGSSELTRKDGFGIVTLGWVCASLVGALPYLFSGVIPSFIPAVFETMSGLTTTGASVLTDLEQLPRGILFWRAMTHWFGGMGVLVLCVAILPFLGVGGMQIFRAEMPGPSKDRLTPRIATTAKLLWAVYVLLCLIEAALLRLGGLDWFDAFCHTFATMATGGFSTRTASVGAFQSGYVDIVIIVFMILAGANFALHYRAITGQPLAYFKDPEFRCYLGILLAAALFIFGQLWRFDLFPTVGEALRAACFQTASIMTTTGFVTADFDQWPNASRMLLVLLMFIGGCAGSTGGGIKVVRVFVLFKKVLRELKRFMQPQAVWTIKLGRKPLEEHIIPHIAAFFIIFLMLFGVLTFVMTFFTPDTETAFSSVIATMGNIGPGLAGVGAMQNYAAIPSAGQALLALCMLLGRLELYTVLILFLPGFWKK